MNSGFAGSASHDDRRRRRLLSEQNEDGVEGGSALLVCRETGESTRNHRYPLKRLLHYKVWRLWLIAVGLTGILASVLYCSWLVEINDEHPALEMLFALENGRLFPVMIAGILLMAGQMSWLIGWARSRSPIDFSGRFRVWSPIGVFFSGLALGILLRFDEILNQSIQHAGLEMPWSVAEWNWMVPVFGIASLVLWIMHGEMRTSRIARVHLWLGVFCLAAGMSAPYIPQLNLPVLALSGLTLGGLMLICQSLLWFTRHVLYVSSDPAKRQPSWTLKVLKSFVKTDPEKAEKKRAEREARKEKALQEKKDKEDKKEEASKAKSRRRGRKKQPAKTKTKPPKISSTTDDVEESSPKASKPSPKTEKPRIRLRAEDITVSSVDVDILQERLDMMELLAEEGEEFDQELLKGLTKKQKKQMRSAWRDLERQYSTPRAG